MKLYKKHVVKELKWARFYEGPPPFNNITNSRRGSIREGLRYEQEVFEALQQRWGNCIKGPWIEFEDDIGYHMAQPDVVYESNGLVYVIECKRTATPKALQSLVKLYRPLLSSIYPRHTIILIQICKYLKPKFKGFVIDSIDMIPPSGVQWKIATVKWRQPTFLMEEKHKCLPTNSSKNSMSVSAPQSRNPRRKNYTKDVCLSKKNSTN